MTKLVWRAGGVTVKTYVLQPGLNTVGRASSNDVRIDEGSISGRHCEILVHEESLQVRDLASTNGTYLDAQRVSEAEIRWGQTLRLGGVDLIIVDPPARVAIPVLERPDGPALFLADGVTPCCPNHAHLPATSRCTQCGAHWCAQCLRSLRRIGGQTMTFCPSCGGASAPFSPEAGATRRRRKVVYWLDRLVDNFRPRPKYVGRNKRRR